MSAVQLVHLQEKHLSTMAQLANNIKIATNLKDYFPHPYHLKDAYEFYQLVKEEKPPRTFVIEFKGEFCGIIGLTLKSDIYRHSADLGYWIGESFWGQGITTKAIQLMVQYAFGELALQRLAANVFEYNAVSMKVLEKNGFVSEGILKNGAIKDQQLIDLYLYGITKS